MKPHRIFTRYIFTSVVLDIKYTKAYLIHFKYVIDFHKFEISQEIPTSVDY